MTWQIFLSFPAGHFPSLHETERADRVVLSKPTVLGKKQFPNRTKPVNPMHCWIQMVSVVVAENELVAQSKIGCIMHKNIRLNIFCVVMIIWNPEMKMHGYIMQPYAEHFRSRHGLSATPTPCVDL